MGKAKQVVVEPDPRQQSFIQPEPTLLQKLTAKRDELAGRLDNGAARIEEARAKGKDVQEWEDYWIRLLRHYEDVRDRVIEIEKEAGKA